MELKRSPLSRNPELNWNTLSDIVSSFEEQSQISGPTSSTPTYCSDKHAGWSQWVLCSSVHYWTSKTSFPIVFFSPETHHLNLHVFVKALQLSLGLEQTSLIAACKWWINDPRPVWVNSCDAHPETLRGEAGVMRENRQTTELQMSDGAEKKSGREETGIWRERDRYILEDTRIKVDLIGSHTSH